MSREKEHFLIVCLDSRRRLISIENLSIGTVNQTLVHPREVFKPAIVKAASYIILAHNHPTGDISPSLDDMQITERLIEASRVLGIPILDHLIVSDGNFLSFKDEEYIAG
jgi:DNA repair protein RadC